MPPTTTKEPAKTAAEKKALGTAPRWLERYMLFVAVAGNGIFYFQVGKILYHQSAKDVSLPAFLCSTWALGSWLLYSFYLGNRVLLIANIVGLIGAFLVDAAILWYS